jgi:hypothetical protein
VPLAIQRFRRNLAAMTNPQSLHVLKRRFDHECALMTFACNVDATAGASGPRI